MNSQQPSGIASFFWLLAVAVAVAGGDGTVLAQGTTEPARAGMSAWDTGTPAAAPLTEEAVAQKGGWKLIATAQATAGFQGDAAIGNGRLLAVARKQGT